LFATTDRLDIKTAMEIIIGALAAAEVIQHIGARPQDHALDDPDLLPPPDEVAVEIVESLETALDRFRNVARRSARNRYYFNSFDRVPYFAWGCFRIF
jgi:hypothetical protein